MKMCILIFALIAFFLSISHANAIDLSLSFNNPPETSLIIPAGGWSYGYPYQRNIMIDFTSNPGLWPADENVAGAKELSPGAETDFLAGSSDLALYQPDWLSFSTNTERYWTNFDIPSRSGFIGIFDDDNAEVTFTVHLNNAPAIHTVKHIWLEMEGIFYPIADPNDMSIMSIDLFPALPATVVASSESFEMLEGNAWRKNIWWQIEPSSSSEDLTLRFSTSEVPKTLLVDYIHIATESTGSLIDSDGDGLPDEWEIYGYDADNDGIVDIDLPAMGANPLRKDLFVEIDWMQQDDPDAEGGTHSDKFSNEAIWRVQEAFLNAPVVNPDGSLGISLHVDNGPESIMNPLTMETWGDRGRATAVLPHRDMFSDPADIWGTFDRYKREYFLPAREKVFTYALAVHRFSEGFNGIARAVPASDFIVSLGASPESVVARLGGFQTGTRSVINEAGVFMHELGHTLGLGHGGHIGVAGYDTMNYKPNYLSVMNYAFTYRGLLEDDQWGHLDYLRFDMPTLDEAALNEERGFDAGPLLNSYGSVRYCGDSEDTAIVQIIPRVNGPIDWNCNNTIEAADIIANVNTCEWLDDVCVPSFTKLVAEKDWPYLRFNGGVKGASGGQITTDPPEERPEEELSRMSPRPYEVLVGGEGLFIQQPGTKATYTFVVVNNGLNPDEYAITAVSSNGFADTSAVPSTGELGAGEHMFVSIPISVPTDAVHGNKDELTVRAESLHNRLLVGRATTTTIVATVRPVANAGDDQIRKMPQVKLDGSRSLSPSGVPLQFSWTGPFIENGGVAFGANPTITLPPGTHEIVLVVSDGVSSSKDSVVIYEYGNLDGDADIDQNDLNIILGNRNKPASACPACDLDGDGIISALDARKLVLLCTRPRCATN